jgi:hypothetical protein
MCEGEKSGWDAAGRRVGGAALSRVRSLDFWKRRLPFLAWLPTYSFESFFCDCIAGTYSGCVWPFFCPKGYLVVSKFDAYVLLEQTVL